MGATNGAAFFRIILPLARPGLATVAIFAFLAGWNDLVFALSFTDRDTFRPVTAGTMDLIGINVTDWNAAMAYATLAMLPTLVIFLLAQRFIVSGLTAGSGRQELLQTFILRYIASGLLNPS